MADSASSKKSKSRRIFESISYGGEALFGGVNAVTPHWAGAVDVVAVRQPGGAIKSSPFYVRFGKYQTFRRNRAVTVRVNDVTMDFTLELGQYGSALFAHEQAADAAGGRDGAPAADAGTDGGAAEGHASPGSDAFEDAEGDGGPAAVTRTASANAMTAMAFAAEEAAAEGDASAAAAAPSATAAATHDAAAAAARLRGGLDPLPRPAGGPAALGSGGDGRARDVADLAATHSSGKLSDSASPRRRPRLEANGSLRMSPEELRNLPIATYVAAPGHAPPGALSPVSEEVTLATDSALASLQSSVRVALADAHTSDHTSQPPRSVSAPATSGSGGGEQRTDGSPPQRPASALASSDLPPGVPAHRSLLSLSSSRELPLLPPPLPPPPQASASLAGELSLRPSVPGAAPDADVDGQHLRHSPDQQETSSPQARQDGRVTPTAHGSPSLQATSSMSSPFETREGSAGNGPDGAAGGEGAVRAASAGASRPQPDDTPDTGGYVDSSRTRRGSPSAHFAPAAQPLSGGAQQERRQPCGAADSDEECPLADPGLHTAAGPPRPAEAAMADAPDDANGAQRNGATAPPNNDSAVNGDAHARCRFGSVAEFCTLASETPAEQSPGGSPRIAAATAAPESPNGSPRIAAATAAHAAREDLQRSALFGSSSAEEAAVLQEDVVQRVERSGATPRFLGFELPAARTSIERGINSGADAAPSASLLTASALCTSGPEAATTTDAVADTQSVASSSSSSLASDITADPGTPKATAAAREASTGDCSPPHRRGPSFAFPRDIPDSSGALEGGAGPRGSGFVGDSDTETAWLASYDGASGHLEAASPHARAINIGSKALVKEEQQFSAGGGASVATGSHERSASELPGGKAADDAADETDPFANDFMQRFRVGAPVLDLSLCWPELNAELPPAAVLHIFSAHKLAFSTFSPEHLSDPGLAVRLGTRVYRHSDAQAFLTAAVVFGIEDAKRHAALLPAEWYPIAVPKAKRRRGWLTSIFWGSGDVSASKDGKGKGKSGDGARAENNATRSRDAPGGDAPGAEGQDDGAMTGPGSDGVSGGSPGGSSDEVDLTPRSDGAGEAAPSDASRHRVAKVQSTHATPAQLAAMAEHLQPGQNLLEFEANGQRVHSFLYLFDWNIRLVVSDIDGTITKSDMLGHVLPRFGNDYAHEGITRLFANVAENGYQFMFLSSRSIAQSEDTRAYLVRLKHGRSAMPAGPVIISPHGIIPSLYREMILKRPHEFKIAALQSVRDLFPEDWNPFYAGFGNRGTDEVSYLHVGIPERRIFTINSQGIIRQYCASMGSSTQGAMGGSGAIAAGYYDSLAKIDADVDMLFPVTETARRRLALQAAATANATAVARAASAAAAEKTGKPKKKAKKVKIKGKAAKQAAAEAQAEATRDLAVAKAEREQCDADAAAPEEDAVATGAPVVPENKVHAVLDSEPLVDVDEREEFNDAHFWREDALPCFEDIDLPPPAAPGK